MKCVKCDHDIPRERLEAIPGVDTCVRCSETSKKIGFPVFSHKTAPSLMFVPNNPESLRQAQRANRRAR